MPQHNETCDLCGHTTQERAANIFTTFEGDLWLCGHCAEKARLIRKYAETVSSNHTKIDVDLPENTNVTIFTDKIQAIASKLYKAGFSDIKISASINPFDDEHDGSIHLIITATK